MGERKAGAKVPEINTKEDALKFAHEFVPGANARSEEHWDMMAKSILLLTEDPEVFDSMFPMFADPEPEYKQQNAKNKGPEDSKQRKPKNKVPEDSKQQKPENKT